MELDPKLQEDLAVFMKKMNEAQQEMVPPELKAKGWRYQDFPGTFSPEAWEALVAVIGKDEHQLVAYSEGTKNGLPFKRGQFFISPQGLSNLGDKERRGRIFAELNFT